MKLTQGQRNLVYQLNGLVKFLNSGGKPSVVPQWQIDAIRKVTDVCPDKVGILSSAQIGLKGIITVGPLAGLVGELVEVLNQKYFIIRLEGLDKILRVAIPEAAFDPLQGSADMKASPQKTDVV